MPTAPILLVDDHADSRTVFSTILRHHGYDVLEAPDGDAALLVLRTVVPAVVVTDLNMPGLDGASLIRALRCAPATAAVPTLVVTADTTAQGRNDALTAGCSAFLLKPLLPRELVAAVRTLVVGQALAASGSR